MNEKTFFVEVDKLSQKKTRGVPSRIRSVLQAFVEIGRGISKVIELRRADRVQSLFLVLTLLKGIISCLQIYSSEWSLCSAR